MLRSAHPRLPLPPDSEPWFDPTPTPPTRQTRTYVRDEHDRRKYTRQVLGGAWQARVWIGGPGRGFSLNLGLSLLRDHGYDRGLTEQASAKVSREFVKRWQGSRTIGDVVEEMCRAGVIRGAVVVPEWCEGMPPVAWAGETEDREERRERLRRERDERRYGSAWPLLVVCGLAA